MIRSKAFSKLAGLILICLLLLFPQAVSAHAVLIQADPPPNSHLDVSPGQITLVFNERLEKELYYIRVFDAQGKGVTTAQTAMSLDQTTISLKLPSLEDGLYTVTYHIISADGHPVEKAYTLTVGAAAGPADALAQTTDDQGHNHGGFALWIDRMLYYFSLLALTGWIFWGMRSALPSDAAKREYGFWLKYLKLFYLFMLASVGFVQMSGLLDGLGFGEIVTGLGGTTFGRTWLFSFAAAVLGYFLLRRWLWFDLLWILAIWAAEAINGHAFSFGSKLYSVSLDAVHLAAASVWTGGLLFILIFWRKDKEWTKRFIPLFSKTAFWSICLLAATGLLLTLSFVPKLSYLVATEWGILVLIKILLVILVIPVAYMLRLVGKQRRDASFRAWFRRDFALMLLIVLIVGELTYTSPLPSNRPLYWQASQNGITATAAIQPNNPGVENSFEVQVKLPDPAAKPGLVELWLYYLGKPEIAPIQVPLKSEAPPASGNRGVYLFDGNGPYLSLPGSWRLELKILDNNDNETDFSKKMRIFQIK